MKKDIKELIEKIKKYNKLYRDGKDSISDSEFDVLLDELKSKDQEEYNKLKPTLFEKSGTYKHKYIIGSLDKIKNGEEDVLNTWKKNVGKDHTYVITPKLDGLSMVLYYEKGTLKHAVTRGDSELGEEQFEKIKLIVPNSIPEKETCIIRGECILTNQGFEDLKSIENKEFKNPRNAAVGLVNAKTINEPSIKCLSFIAYQIIDSSTPKAFYIEKLEHLKSIGFEVPPIAILSSKTLTSGILVEWYEEFKDNIDYGTDGLVIQVNDKPYENKKYPDFARAFKLNDLVAETEIIDIKWNLSKSGYFIPVGIINPIELGGATIQRVSLFNKDYIVKNSLGVGSKVIVHKSGDIIPYIKEILTRADVNLPDKCPYCNTQLESVSVDIHCPNKDCPIQISKQLAYFLKNLNIEVASETSLVNWGILDINKLLSFRPKEDSKNQNKFYKELELKLFTSSPKKLIACMDFDGVSLKTFKKLFKEYFKGPIEDFLLFFTAKVSHNIWINKSAKVANVVKGISSATLNQIKSKLPSNKDILEAIVADPRYIGDSAEEIVNNIFENKSFCFTGSFDAPRTNYENLVESLGGSVLSSVSKNLSYLVTNDLTSNSSKSKKAKELGIPILTLTEFKNLCRRLNKKE